MPSNRGSNDVSQDVSSKRLCRESVAGRSEAEKDYLKVSGWAATTDCDPPSYYYDHGLRFVRPYEHQYQTFVKRRWIGRRLLDVLETEFLAFDKCYYADAISSGRISINGQTVTADTVLQDNQRLLHRAVVYEPPVIGDEIDILAVTRDLIAVAKPSSIPVHPGGAYRYNSLIEILRAEIQSATATDIDGDGSEIDSTKIIRRQLMQSLLSESLDSKASVFHPLHRLDRLTSGLVLFGRRPDVARRFEKAFRTGDMIQKTYLARVCGDFRTACVKQAQSCKGTVAGSGLEDKWTLDCKGFVFCLDRKNGRFQFVEEAPITPAALESAKHAETLFDWIAYDALKNESLVKCIPKTGRTHQIRTQLLAVGHPISNDPCYGPRQLPNSGAALQQPADTKHTEDGDFHPHAFSFCGSSVDYFPSIAHVDLSNGQNNEAVMMLSDSESSSQLEHTSGIFLHAWKYSMGDEFTFSTPIPLWATGCDGHTSPLQP